MELPFYQLHQFMNTISPISAAEWEIASTILSVKSIPPHQKIFSPNSVFNYLLFVNSGLVRTYYIAEDGRDAHAGVLVILFLIAQLLIDNVNLSPGLEGALRIGFPVAAILVSGGFFASAIGQNIIKPNQYIFILYAGALLLAACLIALGIALIEAR